MEAIVPSSVTRLVIEEVIASEWRLLAGLIGKGNAPQILVNGTNPGLGHGRPTQ
jgi:D-aminopeptidase